MAFEWGGSNIEDGVKRAVSIAMELQATTTVERYNSRYVSFSEEHLSCKALGGQGRLSYPSANPILQNVYAVPAYMPAL